MSGWQPIETLRSTRQVCHNQIVLSRFYQPIDDDGEAAGEMEIAWAHVAYPTHSGWRVGTGGFVGVHGFASFPLSDATHWMYLPTPPAGDPA